MGKGRVYYLTTRGVTLSPPSPTVYVRVARVMRDGEIVELGVIEKIVRHEGPRDSGIV